MFIVDLGCNVGDTIKEFLEKYPNAFIFGIDLDQSAVIEARENLKEYAAIIIQRAIGWPERDDIAWIDVTSTVSTINPYQIERLNTFAHPQPIHVYTLDQVLGEFGFSNLNIDILKIDIEGEEENLIMGGGQWLAKTSEIHLECHTEEAIDKCSEFLEVHGFTVNPITNNPADRNQLIAIKNA